MEVKNADSWCWKSLLISRTLLEKGIKKRVGDGESINIWIDRWLPGTEDGKVTTQQSPNCRISKLSELIQDGKWKEEPIRSNFNGTDRSNILNIPLSLQKAKDRIYWAWTTSGDYTIKSGYKKA